MSFAAYLVFMFAGLAIGGLLGFMFQSWWWGKGQGQWDAAMREDQTTEFAHALEAIARGQAK